MVEAGGIEPPSEGRDPEGPTCLARLWFFRPTRRAGPGRKARPEPSPQEPAGEFPRLSPVYDARPFGPENPEGGRAACSIRQRERNCCWQLSCADFYGARHPGMRLQSLLDLRRVQYAPTFQRPVQP